MDEQYGFKFNGVLKNAVKCNGCGDVIESRARHEYVTCSCGDVSVDGGREYLRRCFRPGASYTERTEYV